MKLEYLFVYGSLRKAMGHPAHEFVQKYYEYIGEAKTKGILYNLTDFPAAIQTDDEKYIVGELYKIKNLDELSFAMAQIDDYEGVLDEDGNTPLYKKVKGDVILENGDNINAWVYFYNRNIDSQSIIESGDILDFQN